MKDKIHVYKVIKVIELAVFIILEAVLLIILVTNKTLRSSIFVDKSLFNVCTVAYATVLFALGVIIYDFIKLRELKIEDHRLESLAFLDKQTGIPNRTGVNLIFDNYNTPESLQGIGCVVAEISNIKEINASYGKETGDRAIRDFTKILEKCAEGYGFVGRNGGNEYIAVIEKCDSTRMLNFFRSFNAEISRYNDSDSTVDISVHSEYALFDSEEVNSFSELVSKVYQKLGK